MACEKCLKYEGDSTTGFDEFEESFEIIKRSLGFSYTVEGGTAKCRACHQKIEYLLDCTLIPKMQIEFIED